ncbi:MAG: hypothetical protein ACKVQA_16035 [Burkholderiales bacterium]
MKSALFMLLMGWLSCCGLLSFRWRRQLSLEWNDPVFRVPVLVFESDDWGPGPEQDAEALKGIGAVLSQFSDATGRHPVMTLGVILGIADGEWIAASGFKQYRSIPLADPRYAAIVEEMRRGTSMGVFAPQMHGGEHYWPPALLARAREDSVVRSWVGQGQWARTESLPSELQTRWADCTVLPSVPVADSEIRPAVEAEVKAFSEVFGFAPRVVVPPTFVWTESVEKTWASQQIAVLVTPGRMLTGRDLAGKLIQASQTWNGQRSASGMTYVVRDVYFEPGRGHRAEDLVRAMVAKTRCGRPTLVETHRDNFTASAELRTQSVTEIARAIKYCKDKFPSVRFISTEELAEVLMAKSPQFIEHRLVARALVFLWRVRANPSLRKYSLVTGLALLSWLGVRVLARPGFRAEEAPH